MGVSAFPGCGGLNSGFICKFIDNIVKMFVYWGLSQNLIGPAGYFRDPHNIVDYIKYSNFLPSLNNERGTEYEKLIRKS